MQAARTDLRDSQQLGEEGGLQASAVEWGTRGLEESLERMWVVPAGEPNASQLSGPVAMGASGRLTGPPVTWSCWTNWGGEGMLHVPPSGLTGLMDPAQQQEGSQANKDKPIDHHAAFWIREKMPSFAFLSIIECYFESIRHDTCLLILANSSFQLSAK